MAQTEEREKEPCKDGKDCPPFVTNELCIARMETGIARMETLKEVINSIKKTIWASAATVGFAVTVIEVVLRVAGR